MMSDFENKKSEFLLIDSFIIKFAGAHDPLRYYEQNKPRVNDLEETPQKYVATDRIKHLFHSISIICLFNNIGVF